MKLVGKIFLKVLAGTIGLCCISWTIIGMGNALNRVRCKGIIKDEDGTTERRFVSYSIREMCDAILNETAVLVKRSRAGWRWLFRR